MSAETEFQTLIARVKSGDQDAAAELVRTYEPTIRVMVRRRLTDPKLRRVFDSMDVCQSVLAKFFQAASTDQVQLTSPQDLLNLLATMARNKIISHARKQSAARRQPEQGAPADWRESAHAAPGPSPSQVVSSDELHQEVSQRLTAEERQLAELRAAGRSWSEIASEVGGSPDGLRMQYTRAVARVARELGLDLKDR
jgi:RNA polymerase sigma-70 factor (ECF subfamily)